MGFSLFPNGEKACEAKPASSTWVSERETMSASAAMADSDSHRPSLLNGRACLLVRASPRIFWDMQMGRLDPGWLGEVCDMREGGNS